MRRLATLALALAVVGGLNWGLVGLFRSDLAAASFGGVEFGGASLAGPIADAAAGLPAVCLLARIRALLGGWGRVPSAA